MDGNPDHLDERREREPANHENNLLDNLHEKGYYPPIEMRNGNGNGACGGKAGRVTSADIAWW